MTARRSSPRRQAAHLGSALVLAALAALFVLHPFSPSLPDVGLDASWVAVLGEAAVKGARWGIDRAFTYGPASALVTLYGGSDYVVRTLPLLLALALIYGTAATGVIVTAPGRGRRILAFGLVAAATVLSHCSRDTLLILLPFLVFLFDLGRTGGRRTGESDRREPDVLRDPMSGVRHHGLGVAFCAFGVGMSGLSKTTVPMSAVALFLIGDAAALARRRVPLLLASFAIGFLAAYLAYGQSLADLGTFLRMQSEVASGYSEAMALDGQMWELGLYLVLALALVAAVAGLGRDRAEAIAAPLGVAMILFMLFKAGFVRHDQHSMIAITGLWLCAAILGPTWLLPARPAIGWTTITGAVLGMLLVTPFLTARAVPPPSRLAVFLHTAVPAWPDYEVANLIAFVRSPAAFAAKLDRARGEAWAAIAAEHPLPHLDGRVDVIPSIQSEIIANGLDYRPRPSFQNYSTYTPALVVANRRFVAGPEGPDWILFGLDMPHDAMTIDGRFPAFAEGASWPDLIRLYRPERQVGGLVAIERRRSPLADPVGPSRTVRTGFDEEVAVGGHTPVFARVIVRPTLLGRLAAILFHPPILTMEVKLADGAPRRFRFVPVLGETGFVLSPLVTNPVDFTALATGHMDLLSAKTVVSLRIDAPPMARPFFAPKIVVELSPLTPPREDAPALAARPAWDNLVAASPTPVEGGLIPVAVPSATAVPTPGLARFDVGYGLEGQALRSGEGICFAIEAADGSGTRLWTHCLDAAEADGSIHRLSLDLPPGTTEVLLETACPAGCDGLDAFWGKAADPTTAAGGP